MDALAFEARTALRRVETYSMVHDIVSDLIQEAQVKSLSTLYSSRSNEKIELQKQLFQVLNNRSTLQLNYAEFAHEVENIRFKVETSLWAASAELKLKHRLEQVAARLRDRVLQQHTKISQLQAKIRNQKDTIERQQHRIQVLRPTGDQLIFRLPGKILLDIFSYLSVNSLASFAATNRAIYGRVDALLRLTLTKGVRLAPGVAIGSSSNSEAIQSPASFLGSGLGLGFSSKGALPSISTSGGEASTSGPHSAPRRRLHLEPDRGSIISEDSLTTSRGQTSAAGSQTSTAQSSGRKRGLFSSQKDRGVDYKEASKLLAHIKQLDQELINAKSSIQDLKEQLRTAEQVKAFLAEQNHEAEVKASQARDEADNALEQNKSDRQVLRLLDSKLQNAEAQLMDAKAEVDLYKQRMRDLQNRFEKELQSQALHSNDTCADLKAEVSRLKLQLQDQDNLLQATVLQRDKVRDTAEVAQARIREYEAEVGDDALQISELKAQRKTLAKEVKRLRNVLIDNGLSLASGASDAAQDSKFSSAQAKSVRHSNTDQGRGMNNEKPRGKNPFA